MNSANMLTVSRPAKLTSLSSMLSGQMEFYIKTRKLQWNALDESFSHLHQLFQGLYVSTEETMDLLSDRINQLGGKSVSVIQEGADLSRHNQLQHSHKDIMTELLREHEAMSMEINSEIKNSNGIDEALGSGDFLLDIMAQHKTTNSTLRNIDKAISEVSMRSLIQHRYNNDQI